MADAIDALERVRRIAVFADGDVALDAVRRLQDAGLASFIDTGADRQAVSLSVYEADAARAFATLADTPSARFLIPPAN